MSAPSPNPSDELEQLRKENVRLQRKVERLKTRRRQKIEAAEASLPENFSDQIDPSRPPVLVNSMPKSGTHLLGKCIDLVGYHNLDIAINDTAFSTHGEPGEFSKWAVLKGRDKFLNPSQTTAPAPTVLSRIRGGQYAMSHVTATPGIQKSIEENGIRQIFIVRDPRDIAVSFYQHCTYRPEKCPPLNYYYVLNALKSDSERLLTVIEGIPVNGFLPDILNHLIGPRLGWLEHEATHVVRFEDLVGPQGGGDRDRQREAVRGILQFLGEDDGDDNITNICNQVFGGDTHTFSKGQIGRWKEEFEDIHREAFKRVTGDVLQRLGYEVGSDW